MKRVLMISLAIFASIPVLISVRTNPGNNAWSIFKESGLNNTVTVLYLRNRMYDTIFEVLVFSSVALGIHTFHVGREKGLDRVHDSVFSSVLGFVSFTIGIVAVYLAVSGHLYPGGGFTAGVAGGTALLLAGMRMGVDEFEKKYENFKVEGFEKVVVIVIVFLAVLEFFQLVGPGVVPVQSTLVFLKVTGSTWIIIHTFLKHRGII